MNIRLTYVALLLCALLGCAAKSAAASPLTVQGVQCRGNDTTSCAFIRNHLYLRDGDLLDETEVRNAQLRLSSLPNFDSVEIRLEKGDAPGRAHLVIEVIEARPVRVESLLGTLARVDSVSQILALRLSHQNVFGTGKLVDLTLVGRHPVEGPTQRGASVLLRYADPNLFGSNKYFAIASVLALDAYGEDELGRFADDERLRFGLSFGRRLWDFSYLTVGYGYQASLLARTFSIRRNGSFELEDHRNRHAVDIIYGWNSEDDFYFPTRGSAFHVGFGWDFGSGSEDNELHLQFRKTWATGNGGYWTMKIGGDPSTEYRQALNDGQLISVSYARALSGASGSLERGRWYIEPGFSEYGYRRDGTQLGEIGLKVGIRLQTATFGIIDLYVFGSSDVTLDR
jgi:hypothetical protein